MTEIACMKGPRTPGQILHGIRDKDGVWHDVPVRVMREATFEEFKEYAIGNGTYKDGYDEEVRAEYRFYEVSLD